MKEKTGLSINIFWIIIVFILDPGGYIFNNLSTTGRTMSTFVFLIVAFLIFNYHYTRDKMNLFSLKYVKAYIYVMIVWNLYHFIVYYGFNNNTYPGFFKLFIINPNIIFKSAIVIPIIYFSTFSLNSFFRILIWSTIVIGSFFIITTFTPINLMDTWRADRNVGGAKRSFMYGYGLINFVIPIAISILFLKFKLSKKVLLAFLIALSVILITVWRRDIIGVIEYVVVVAFLVNYMNKKFFLYSITKYVNLKTIVMGFVFIFMLSVFASNFLNSASDLAMGTLGSLGLVENTNAVSRTDGARMSLTAKIGIVQAIKDNFYFGTGYDQNWYTGDGGEKGWEGSDYIFLATFGMYGIVGLILFLPFYVLSIKVVISFMKLVRSKKTLIYRNIKHLALPTVIGIAAASEFVKNIIEYPNWFYPIGAIHDQTKFFIFLGLLLGCYHNINFKVRKKTL